MKIIVVAGTQPNFIKMAPILAELHADKQSFIPLLVYGAALLLIRWAAKDRLIDLAINSLLE
jgi:hypothetical protein